MMDKLKSLPLVAQIGGLVATVGAVVVAGRMISGRALLIILFGLLLAALCVGLWLLWQRYQRQRQASGLRGQISRHSTVAPRGLSDPAQRAKLDNLRQTFQKGLDRFRAAGKDLYSLPWYMVVGEPGSGKTEAIRHCNVGFPPGLQDELQGAGGTINMNWWFTNYSVILDTAGRLMFEEVAPGSTSEWREFLGLLRARRPNCPINGLILVIPADSLIKDTADEIGQKASRIAQQFSTIQGALDVRFPVFVLITKTDLLNGFREFFENVKDPHLQHQMLGWSNPDPLDQVFRPDLVDKHLDQVVHRVRRRRLGLMSDPTPQGDYANGRRLDDVDALFALPASVALIAPRLRRYLEMIFMPNEWSGKPLFLRGIYFTSAMREGSALDQELAEAIGVSVDSLPEGKTWERERAYFLRDLFIEKIFREKGLVTRASNTRTMLRRQKAIFRGGVGVLLVALALVAWLGRTSVRQSVGRELEYWRVAADGWQENAWRPIVSPKFKNSADYEFNGEQEVVVGVDKFSLTEYHRHLAELVEKNFEVPWVFRPMSGALGGTNASRRAAQRIVFEASVIRPIVEGARDRLQRTADRWSAASSATLAFLVRLECMIHYRSAGLSSTEIAPEGFFEPLGGFLYPDVKSDPALLKTFEWTYLKDGDGQGYWPPSWLSGGDSLRENGPINVGLRAFLVSTQKVQKDQEAGFDLIKKVRDELQGLRKAEAELFRIASQPASADSAVKTAADVYLQNYSSFKPVRSMAEGSGLFPPGPIQLFVSHKLLVEETRKQIDAAAKLLQSEIDRFGGGAAAKDASFPLAADIRRALQQVQSQVKARTDDTFTEAELADLQALDRLFLERTPAGDPLVFIRSELYNQAVLQIDGGGSGLLVGNFTKSVDTLSSTISSARESVARYQGAFALELNTIMRRLLDYGQTRGLEALYDRYLAEIDGALRGKIGFPLVRDSTSPMTLENLTAIAKLMSRARGDLPGLRASRPPGRSVARLDVLENNVTGISTVADALLADGGKTAIATVLLVNDKDQEQGIKQRLNVEDYNLRFTGKIWRALRINGGSMVNAITPTNTENPEVAKVNVATPNLRIDHFFSNSDPKPDEVQTIASEWALLRLLHDSKPRRLSGGKEWEIALSLKDKRSGQDRLLLLVLQFEKPLPELEQWPTTTRLGF